MDVVVGILNEKEENIMNRQIRREAFETNSSSSHSISIYDTEGMMDISLYPNEEGEIHLLGGVFGWKEETFCDAQTKASYLAIYAEEWSGDKKEEFRQILIDVIREQTGCKKVVFDFILDLDDLDDSDIDPQLVLNYNNSIGETIDHQSVENKDYHYLFEDKEKLRQFIFNKRSWLKTGNDNG